MATGPCRRCGSDEWYLYTRGANGRTERTCRPCMLEKQASMRKGVAPRPYPAGNCFRCGTALTGQQKSWCQPCHSQHRLTRWRALKIELVDEMGGKCSCCGWAPKSPREYAAIDFHHIDPSQKSHSVSGNSMLRKNVRAEAAKCELLCANCHRIHHTQEWEAPIKLTEAAS